MSAGEILIKAVLCDQANRILEAQILYEEGIEILMNLISNTKTTIDPVKKARYNTRIKEYVDRSLSIKARIENHISKGASVMSVPIADDSVGHSYASLFGQYFDGDVKEILLEEPYLCEKYHFQNLVMFLELSVQNCKDLKYMLIVTKRDTKTPENQREILHNLHEDLGKRGITLAVKYDDTLHDRKIILSNGFVIKLGRGLHIFKANTPLFSLGLNNYNFRKCLKSEMDVFRTTSFNEPAKKT